MKLIYMLNISDYSIVFYTKAVGLLYWNINIAKIPSKMTGSPEIWFEDSCNHIGA